MIRLPDHDDFYPPVDFSNGNKGRKERLRKNAIRRETRVESLKALIAKRDKVLRERAQKRNRAENSAGTDKAVNRLGREAEIFTSRVFDTITDLETRDTGILIQKIREFENAIPANGLEHVEAQTADILTLMKMFYPAHEEEWEAPLGYNRTLAFNPERVNGPYAESTHSSYFAYYHWKQFLEARELLVARIKQTQERSESADALVDEIIRNFDYGKTVKNCNGNQELLGKLIEGVDKKRVTIEGLIDEFITDIKDLLLSVPTQAFADYLRRLKHLDQRGHLENEEEQSKLLLAIKICEEQDFNLCGKEDFERLDQEGFGRHKNEPNNRFRKPRVAPERRIGSQILKTA